MHTTFRESAISPWLKRAALALAGGLSLSVVDGSHAADIEPHAPGEVLNTAGSFTFENDLFFNSDRYYTDGVQIVIKQQNLKQVGSVGRWAFEACDVLICPSTKVDVVRHKIGQLMYTPVRITVSAPQPFDRPWAGMLYYTRDYEYVNDARDYRTIISGTLGVIGPGSLAEQTQKWIHRTFSGATPRGWDNQIGGQLGIMAIVEQRYGLPLLSSANRSGVQVATTGSWRVAVGNIMTFAGIGGTIALGKNLEPSSEKQEPISTKRAVRPVLQPLTSPLDPQAASQPASTSCLFSWLQCSAFVSGEIRGMLWNVFLDGRMFHSDPSVDSKPFVADATAGVRLDFPTTRNELTGPWYVSLSATRRSPEFSGRRGTAHSQSFGTVTIGTEF